MPSIFPNFHFTGEKKSISELKIKSFNIIIAIGWVLEGKDSKYDMSCRQASLVSNELLRQKENCSWPKLKDKLRLDEKKFEEGGSGSTALHYCV